MQQSTPVHQCSCGQSFTLAQWQQLPFVGTQATLDDELLELRNCSCGSTRAIDIAARRAPLVALVQEHTKLTTRAIEQARAEAENANRLADELERALFDSLCGPQSRPVNSAFELECVSGGAS